MKKDIAFFLLLLAGLSACGMTKDEPTNEVDQNASSVDFKAKETRTLSNLAKLEASVAAYIEAEKKIPPDLDSLIPRYLADIPTVELGLSKHRDNNDVKVYPAAVLRDGAIDGSQLKDSGRWGYVHNDRQVVIFVDCTHRTSGGSPWYQARGVF
jgi:hypothetical protein